MNTSENLLDMTNISKSFSGVKVLDDVELHVKKGEVHVLIGENGAGKSTLMKILIGMYKKDTGKVYLRGKEINVSNTREALAEGIAMIHQELSPVPEMTVAENLYLGREFTGKTNFFVNQKKMINEAAKLFAQLGIEGIQPAATMKTLSLAQVQMVEIAKTVSQNAELIVMDEPTSAITDREVEKLFSMIRDLKSKGVAIIYISHKMDEIYEIGDTITVLRDGKYIATESKDALTREKLIKLMVGRELNDLYDHHPAKMGNTVLEVKNLSNGKLFRNVSFKVQKGEILGVSGLMGAGRTEVMETIFGMRGKYEGEIFKDGKKIEIKSEKDAISNGLALATEDRKNTGLFLGLSIETNISMAHLDPLSKFGIVNIQKEHKEVMSSAERLKIKMANVKNSAGTLSGGNQQKVVLAKWLMTDPDVLILDEPTRGIDIGAKAEIYKIMEELAQQGKAIIMVSSEMQEIIGVSDRIIVMADGTLTGELSRNEATQEKIMTLASNIDI